MGGKYINFDVKVILINWRGNVSKRDGGGVENIEMKERGGNGNTLFEQEIGDVSRGGYKGRDAHTHQYVTSREIMGIQKDGR